MLKLLQKLSEISGEDKKQSVLLENASTVEGCGDMSPIGAMSSMGSIPPAPRTPASINMTASSGPELSGMLKDLMSLAGIHQVTPDHMPAIKMAIPTQEPMDKMDTQPDMRKMLDSMNYPEEEAQENYDNSPADPTDVPLLDVNANAYDSNAGGDHRDRKADLPKAVPESTVDSIHKELFFEYQKFIQ